MAQRFWSNRKSNYGEDFTGGVGWLAQPPFILFASLRSSRWTPHLQRWPARGWPPIALFPKTRSPAGTRNGPQTGDLLPRTACGAGGMLPLAPANPRTSAGPTENPAHLRRSNFVAAPSPTEIFGEMRRRPCEPPPVVCLYLR